MNAKKLIGQYTDRLVMNVLLKFLSLRPRRAALIMPHKFIHDTFFLRSTCLSQSSSLLAETDASQKDLNLNALFVHSIEEVLRRKDNAEFDAKKKLNAP